MLYSMLHYHTVRYDEMKVISAPIAQIMINAAQHVARQYNAGSASHLCQLLAQVVIYAVQLVLREHRPQLIAQGLTALQVTAKRLLHNDPHPAAGVGSRAQAVAVSRQPFADLQRQERQTGVP